MSTLQAWREESRQDRLTQARIDRDREAARVQARIAEREAAARVRREEAQARAAARALAHAARSARRAARLAWLGAHAVDLLFVPVVVVPAVLAWTAMASYGALLYGPAGLTLPALSEGGMWTFAAATTITRRRNPGRPLWHLRAGTAVFAVIGAVLNFAHGITAPGLHGPGIAVVYAVVSVAGVTAHQLVTAGPRRSRADRDAARTARAVARRERAARRAAVRRALVDLDEHGTARLVFEPGLARLDHRLGRTRLVPEAAPAAAPSAPESGEGAAEDDAAALRAEIGSVRAALREDLRAGIETAQAALRAEIEAMRPAAGIDNPEQVPVDRDALVAELADQIRDAITSGDKWVPDYDALMKRTGYRRRWCEKAVQDARTLAFNGPHGTRTDDEPDADRSRIGADGDPEDSGTDEVPGS